MTLVNLTELFISLSRVRVHPEPPALLSPDNILLASSAA